LTAATRKQSAVLIPVFRDTDGELRLVLVVRGPGGVHGGKLGPCGEAEVGDRSPLETALREAAEEIGLTRGEIDVLAGLEPVNTRTTNFRVHPYLARVSPRARLRTALGEISGELTPSLRALADRAARGKQQFSWLCCVGWSRALQVRLER
jgi:8-oxo-dGTP pyrophosphatase MutT (NUDIX family)